MESRTRDLTDRMIEAIENEIGEEIEVVGFDINEYIRGDPTNSDSTVSGSEIEVKAFASYEDADDNENDFRVK